MFPIHLDDKTNNCWQRVEYDCEKKQVVKDDSKGLAHLEWWSCLL